MTTIDLPFPGLHSGIERVPTFEGAQSSKEYTSDQEVRWCPGCGDYAILKAVQSFLPELGLRRATRGAFGRGARRRTRIRARAMDERNLRLML